MSYRTIGKLAFVFDLLLGLSWFACTTQSPFLLQHNKDKKNSVKRKYFLKLKFLVILLINA